MKRRVVVTGLGPVSSIGIGKKSFWERAREGKGYFREVDFGDVDLEQYRSRICSPVDEFSISEQFENPKLLKRTGRATQYSVVGAYLALMDSGLRLVPRVDGDKKTLRGYTLEGVDHMRAGVVFGQSVSNSDVLLPAHIVFLRENGPRKVNPFVLPQSNSNVGASTISEIFHMKGVCYTVNTACASATHAIGLAAQHVRDGQEDLIVTGGADMTLEPYFFAGFDIIRALSQRNDDPMHASRPFDRDRDGFVLGEGAGVLVVEALEHAVRRGAHIYGEIAGFGFTADAYNVVAPDPWGRASIHAVRRALESAKVLPREVEYINAHGTSTILNDPNESFIIKQVFGDYAYRIPISASKSYFGHPLGASGGLESIVSFLTMEHGVIAPTSNLDNPDLEYVDKAAPDLDKRCDLDYVPGVPRKTSVNIVLKQSFGFGGQNGVLLFKKYRD